MITNYFVKVCSSSFKPLRFGLFRLTSYSIRLPTLREQPYSNFDPLSPSERSPKIVTTVSDIYARFLPSESPICTDPNYGSVICDDHICTVSTGTSHLLLPLYNLYKFFDRNPIDRWEYKGYSHRPLPNFHMTFENKHQDMLRIETELQRNINC